MRRSKIPDEVLRSRRLFHRPTDVLYLPLAYALSNFVFTNFHYVILQKNMSIFNIHQHFVKLALYETQKSSTKTNHR